MCLNACGFFCAIIKGFMYILSPELVKDSTGKLRNERNLFIKVSLKTIYNQKSLLSIIYLKVY